jgi:hypothetical protein
VSAVVLTPAEPDTTPLSEFMLDAMCYSGCVCSAAASAAASFAAM